MIKHCKLSMINLINITKETSYQVCIAITNGKLSDDNTGYHGMYSSTNGTQYHGTNIINNIIYNGTCSVPVLVYVYVHVY
jgi:hypothetical protein